MSPAAKPCTKEIIEEKLRIYEFFHDWVVSSVKIYAENKLKEVEDTYFIDYRAELKLWDPYKRFEFQNVCLLFYNFESIFANSWSKLTSDIQGVSFEYKDGLVIFRSDDCEYIHIEAHELRIKEY